ncbi:MAG: 50S ribosomal protein L35 [Candidatus Yanofskybacteria bacterium CG10_big_fil_rev_8_21_14_0_10_36_16]|uniref:50S ribosomal protein L35 n=1 Tax=Candidatus Yanofskybacteria bacterium CG10_big_fil_rev_8_21_14_0_10_36_16 TaxID=1975096 RepID=A0A2J0Q807_9BACT|nr:MAG: 50S ribosomal protein L35 [Candidatus Yanofskybacteria bacterium CG10_big_fil_rev_8_21_14_0_10_36_16]
MKKSKISKSAAKRFKKTGTGKIMRRRVKLNHFNAKASGKERRRKRGNLEISPIDEKNIRQVI